MRPAGPEPTTAIGGLSALAQGLAQFFQRSASAFGRRIFSRSGRNHSSWPISSGRPVSVHTPWHCSSCGQTRPVTSGSGFSDSISRSASRNLPVPTSCSISGMWILTGQPPFGSRPGFGTPSSQARSSHCLSRAVSEIHVAEIALVHELEVARPLLRRADVGRDAVLPGPALRQALEHRVAVGEILVDRNDELALELERHVP